MDARNNIVFEICKYTSNSVLLSGHAEIHMQHLISMCSTPKLSAVREARM